MNQNALTRPRLTVTTRRQLLGLGDVGSGRRDATSTRHRRAPFIKSRWPEGLAVHARCCRGVEPGRS